MKVFSIAIDVGWLSLEDWKEFIATYEEAYEFLQRRTEVNERESKREEEGN